MSQAVSILLVESNPILRREWAAGLEERGGFRTRTVSSLSDAGRVIDAECRFDAIILADRLPDGSGKAFCAGLREDEDWTPVIITAARADEVDVVRAFEAGADDHMIRPGLAELVARLRAQLRAARRPVLPTSFGPAFIHHSAPAYIM